MNFLQTLSSWAKRPNFQSWFTTVKDVLKKTKGLFDNVFRPYEHDGIKTSEFTYGLPIERIVASWATSQTNNFREFHSDIPNPENFKPTIPTLNIAEKGVVKPLHLREFKKTSVSPPKPILIERKTRVYNINGEFAESFPKGIFVEFDSTKPVIVAPDGKTYAQTLRHDNTPDGSHVFERLLLRTPSLDEDVRAAKRAQRETVRATSTPPKKNFFEGHFGYKNIIPPAALEKATKEYLATELAKIVQANIAKTDTAIMKTREEIRTEVLIKGKTIDQVPSYHEQKKALSKKHSLTKVNQAIQLFTANGSDALVNPDVEQLLASLKKTPKWQEIIQAATAAENAKIRKRYRG